MKKYVMVFLFIAPILSILIVTLPTLGAQAETKTVNNMKVIATALESFYVDYNAYPTNLKDLKNHFPESTTPQFKDEWDNDLIYITPSESRFQLDSPPFLSLSKTYSLISFGPDRKRDTYDDIIISKGVFVKAPSGTTNIESLAPKHPQ